MAKYKAKRKVKAYKEAEIFEKRRREFLKNAASKYGAPKLLTQLSEISQESPDISSDIEVDVKWLKQNPDKTTWVSGHTWDQLNEEEFNVGRKLNRRNPNMELCDCLNVVNQCDCLPSCQNCGCNVSKRKNKRNPGGVSRGYANSLNWGGPLFRNPDDMPVPSAPTSLPPSLDQQEKMIAASMTKHRRRNPGGVSRGYANSLNWGGPLFRKNPNNREIWGEYRGKKEIIDTAESLLDAKYLVSEYQMAYGPEWVIWDQAADYLENPGGVSRGYANSLNWGGPLFRNPGGVSRGYANSLNWGGPLFKNPCGTNPNYDNFIPEYDDPGMMDLADDDFQENPGGVSRGYANSLNWGGPLFRNPSSQCGHCYGRGLVFSGVCSMCHGRGQVERNPLKKCKTCGAHTNIPPGIKQCISCWNAAKGQIRNPGGVDQGYASAKNWGGSLFRNPGGIDQGYASAKNWGGPLFRNPGGVSRGYANSLNWGGPLFRNPGGVDQGYASAKNWGGPLFRNPEQVWGPKLHDPLESPSKFDKNPSNGLFNPAYSRNPEEVDLDDLDLQELIED